MRYIYIYICKIARTVMPHLPEDRSWMVLGMVERQREGCYRGISGAGKPDF